MDIMDGDSWKRECAVFYGSQQVYLMGRRAGRVASAVAMSKVFPNFKTVVSNLQTLDILVSAGLQPSQIIVTGEYVRPCSAADYLEGVIGWRY